MGVKLLVLTILFLFLGVKSVFAAISFNISNPQQSGDEVTIDVSLSGLTSSSCPNTVCYLQAAFTSQEQTKYFGFTKNNSGQWYEYISSPATSYIQSNFFTFQPVSGAWSGQITIKINPESSNYKGPGVYNINAWRYTGNSSGGAAITSDVLSVNIQSSVPPSSIPTPPPSSSTFSPSTSSFTIANIPSPIDSTEEFKVSVNLSLPKNPNTVFYLKGAFKKQDKTNYFGLTKVNSSWVRNNKNYLDHVKIMTDSNGAWSGSLEIQPDILDSGYEGAGEYIFKVGRYTGDGSLNWSNEVTITINAQEIILEDEEKNQVLGITETEDKDVKPKPSSPEKYSLEKYVKVASPASFARASTPPQVEIKNQKQTNPLFWTGLIFIFAGISSIGYIYLKRNGKIPF